jgi:hypothetical protein
MGPPVEAPDSTAEIGRAEIADVNFATVLAESGQKVGRDRAATRSHRSRATEGGRPRRHTAETVAHAPAIVGGLRDS